MKKIMVAAFLVTACTPAAQLPDMPSGKCSTTMLGKLIGRPATPGLVDRARRLSGASVSRLLRPGQIVTMEYREGRLNVNVDVRNVVTGFGCG
jgi:hypothetical protein